MTITTHDISAYTADGETSPEDAQGKLVGFLNIPKIENTVQGI